MCYKDSVFDAQLTVYQDYASRRGCDFESKLGVVSVRQQRWPVCAGMSHRVINRRSNPTNLQCSKLREPSQPHWRGERVHVGQVTGDGCMAGGDDATAAAAAAVGVDGGAAVHA